MARKHYLDADKVTNSANLLDSGKKEMVSELIAAVEDNVRFLEVRNSISPIFVNYFLLFIFIYSLISVVTIRKK